jgi:spore coat polysaccharide biosynthesis protein SpsF
VATTTNPRDNVIIEECEQRGIPNFRGSETDVLGRYVSAARAARAHVIVRVTADNPFTDPDSIDRVVDAITGCGVDYALDQNVPVGTAGEALTCNALARINAVANTPRWREHVTLYAKEHPAEFRCAFLKAPAELARPDLSFTVDQLHEYEHVRALADSFSTIDFGLKNLVEVADELTVCVGVPAGHQANSAGSSAGGPDANNWSVVS